MTRRALTIAFVATGLTRPNLAGAEPAARAPFSIRQSNGSYWLAKPDGRRFFSLGVCVVDEGDSQAQHSLTNPGFAAFPDYASTNQWAEATLGRLKSWKFTTIGGWSDFGALQQLRDADIAFIPVLAVGMSCGVPWLDMWDTNIIARMHDIAREKILPLRDDTRLLGYYTDNEIGWWNATLFRMTLEQKPTSGQRQRLLQLLRQRYHNDWSALLQDFEAEGAASFSELDVGGRLYLRPGSRGIQTYRQFLGLMAERYYSLVRKIVRSYDKRGLILGDRYQSFYYPEVARASSAFVDAASSNLNAGWDDGTFPRFYLETLHALSGRPILVSEFYLAAEQNRSGNKNDASTFPTVTTQKERAAGFRNTAQALARLPYLVGADWFQYYDEPKNGRGDGENYNFGLVDIHDRPYEELTTAARRLDLDTIKSRSGSVRLDASLGVPRAPRDPLAHFTIRLALKEWNRERGFVKPASEFPIADLYVCWSKESVYLGLYAQDIVEENYYRNKVVPEIDRAEWSVTLTDTNQTIHARLGPGGPPVWNSTEVRLVNLSGIYMNTRNVAAMALPVKLFGKDSFKAGDQIEFASTYSSHCRADRVDWKGKFRLKD